MEKLKNEYRSFLEDIEKNVKDPQDLEFVKVRLAKFLDKIIDKMDYIVEYKREEMKKLEETQKRINNQMEKMQEEIDNIEKQIYADDEFEFEITCPYCDYAFFVDIDEERKEVTCPECENIIELDWTGNVEENEQHGCSGNCGTCHGCGELEEDDEE